MLSRASRAVGSIGGGPAVDRAEARLAELISAAPEASPPVTKAIRRAFVLFYRAIQRWQGAALPYQEVGEFEGLDIVRGYHEVEKCVEMLGLAIGKELLDAEADTKG